MKTPQQSLSWGEELAPLEMQNTQGGSLIEVLLGIAVVDFVVRLLADGGDPNQAMDETVDDIAAIWKGIKALLGIFS